MPWFEIASGVPVYPPPSFFWWWYAFDAYVPDIFVEGATIAASGGILAVVAAVDVDQPDLRSGGVEVAPGIEDPGPGAVPRL